MSQQKINFYKKISRENDSSSSPLTWKRLLLINGMMVGILSLFLLYFLFKNYQLSTLNQRKLAEVSQLQIKVETLKKQFPVEFFSQDLNTSLQELEKNIAQQKKLLDGLVTHTLFSKILAYIANTINTQVWLTEINISEAGSKVELTGHSLSLDNFHSFTKNILNNPDLAHYLISIEDVKVATEEKAIPVTFTIAIEKKPL